MSTSWTEKLKKRRIFQCYSSTHHQHPKLLQSGRLMLQQPRWSHQGRSRTRVCLRWTPREPEPRRLTSEDIRASSLEKESDNVIPCLMFKYFYKYGFYQHSLFFRWIFSATYPPPLIVIIQLRLVNSTVPKGARDIPFQNRFVTRTCLRTWMKPDILSVLFVT